MRTRPRAMPVPLDWSGATRHRHRTGHGPCAICGRRIVGLVGTVAKLDGHKAHGACTAHNQPAGDGDEGSER